VNHLDGDRSNNLVSNLEWVTQSENVQHAFDTGLVKKTIKYSQRMLTEDVVHKICSLIQDSFRNKDIAEILNVPLGRIAEIRNRSCYPDISSEYDFDNILPSRRRISDEKLIGICEMLSNGSTYKQIKEKLGCSSATISRVRKRTHGTYISENYTW
jgi:hypothetical protein